ncbi:MAG: beta-ketoacyl synthase chain length factor [Flavobacteriales bacterium]|jgi:hypothetical protein|nr:beta-ketoacyl synthase chain length factor [Flavobacteriales bacterium]
MYLGAANCISFQDSFLADAPWASLKEINEESKLLGPNYKQYVKPAAIRRMSTVLKMGAAGGSECLKQAGFQKTDAIIVGSGLGCVRDTLRFLKAVYEEDENTLSPTAFIQSTHNSIAGQLALMLGNHNYNMTHVQGNLSLAYALSDAELLINEGDAETVLVGGVDEKTEELTELLSGLANTANYSLPRIGEGAAFFMASKQKLNSSVARMEKLEMTAPSSVDADLILTNAPGKFDRAFNYIPFSGEHFTSVGFGLYLGMKALEKGSIDCSDLKVAEVKSVLVHHGLFGQETSITLEKV